MDILENKIKKTWPNKYFKNRNLKDSLRIKQFNIDKLILIKFINKKRVCDIGCSTGEFMKSIGWTKNVYGYEINDYARKISSEFISFKKNIFNCTNFFDVVVFRGVIQHISEPFHYIKHAYRSLKKNGVIIFLSTPNANCILYKIKKTLPVLCGEKKRIYYIPRDKEMLNVLKNFNFKILKISYPYMNTPYCNLIVDHIKFLLNLFSNKFYPHAFWKSSMDIVAKKK